MEFLQAFGVVFGVVAGVGTTLAIVFKFGRITGELQQDVLETKAAALSMDGKMDLLMPRVRSIEQTLHGPEGNNGLYSDVKELRRRFEDSPRFPKRRRTDRKAS
jgi:hypothetical protein